MDQLHADVCITGAGCAGLAASYKLKQAGKTAAVIEARERIGGRVYSQILRDGTPINWGGTFIGQDHDRLYALVEEMGTETCRQYTEGDNLLFVNGKTHRNAGGTLHINPISLVELGLAPKPLEWIVSEVPIDAPCDAAKDHEQDSQTLGAWIESHLHATTDTAQKMFRAMFTEVFMSDPFEVSLLHALHLVHALKSLEWISGAVGGAGQDDFDWAAEPWSRCDMFTHYAPGVLTGFGQALCESCGRIHWAGTETAGVWSGSIEAAIRSGERAADEVLKR